MSNTISIGGGRTFAVAFVAMMALSVCLGGVAAADPGDEVSYEGDNTTAPNPYYDVDTLTVAQHPMEKGTSDDAMAGYYNDSGHWVSNPDFEVNTTSNPDTGDNVNPYSFHPTRINADFYGAFPRVGDANNSASALDASEWTVDTSNTAGSASVSDTQVARDVDAVQISATSQTSGDTAAYTYSNWTTELDSDEEKRVVQIGAEVDTLDSGTTVAVQFVDESGDYKELLIDPSQNVDTNTNVMANSTGQHVYQVRLSALATNGGGEFNNIENVTVEVRDGNADVSVSWLDLEKKSFVTLAETTVDSDADGTYDETEVVRNSTGQIDTHSMGTLGSAYDSASVIDVQFPATFEASKIEGDEGDEGAYMIEWGDAEQYPSYDHTLTTHYRMDLPNQIDLSYSGLDLVIDQGFISDRYQTLGFEQGVSSDANFTEASLTDRTGSLGQSGDTVVLDSGVSTSDTYVVTAKVLLTDGERNVIEDVSGAAAPPTGSGSGGFVGFITSVPGMLLSAATGFLSFRWLKG